MTDYPKLSRAVSHALRHEPWLYELELDEEGWTSVEDLLQALRRESPDWVNLEFTDLEGMLLSSPKRRHELRGDRIRAFYGHSVPARIVKPQESPPQKLFHGTSRESLGAIQSEGLQPMRRQYVHLSEDVEMAKQVGQRKDTDPVLLLIDSAAAHGEHVSFYQGGEKVWLADSVPARFISVLPEDE
ncbi:RNA 2'-phosphotransferase [Paenarthrobacter sp. CCNWLY172]|uniref:RNA 2'-phosphotransferase n=1 Tax=Micrococcaceae TaxID=1268 RepID=UPI001A990C82|nr:RNA 2'-phosphotransferase [Arthrobacter sp. D5-1]QSZ50203.1 RNA 2'-phosphotransferase [Arthrobacter sp. D5-1]